MSTIVERYNKINSYINESGNKGSINIVAVSKTFSFDYIKPLIDYGHKHFGENKVQEAQLKWKSFKENNAAVKLHMVGKLQSNKAKKAVEHFDFIHSLDSEKLAASLSDSEKKLSKKLKYFIQVNIGLEKQKSGISPSSLNKFYNYCIKEKKLDVIGLMCIPPNDGNTDKHFKTLSELSASLNLNDMSMGMSNDYREALNYGSTFLRIGSSIFGERSKG